MDLEGGWAWYLPGGAENLIPAATRAFIIETFVVATRWIFCALQSDVRPSHGSLALQDGVWRFRTGLVTLEVCSKVL